MTSALGSRVEPAGRKSLKARLPVVGLGQGMAERGEQRTNPLDVPRLVFDQKNFFGHELKAIVAGNAGKSRRTRNQEPGGRGPVAGEISQRRPAASLI
jgi:hypothetical protein